MMNWSNAAPTLERDLGVRVRTEYVLIPQKPQVPARFGQVATYFGLLIGWR